MRKLSKRGKGTIIALLVIIVLGISAGVAGYVFYLFDKTQSSITVEAGTTVYATDFIKHNVQEISFTDGSDKIETNTCVSMKVSVTADNFSRDCVLNVVDTTFPTADPKPMVLMAGDTCEAKDLVENVVDETPVTIDFAESVDWSAYGLREVPVKITDEGNNTTIINSTLNISKVDLASPYAIEAGSYMPDPRIFLVTDGECEYRQSGWDFVDSAHCGIYPVFLLVDGEEVQVKVEIVDSIEPRFEVQDLNDYIGHDLDPAKFVTSCVDATDVTYSYKTEPDMTLENQTVTIVGTDEGGNTYEVSANLALVPDVEPPTILGTGNLGVQVGGTVSYRSGVSVVDNCDEDLEVQIDNSAVDLNVEGSYPVIYTATDHSGNVATVTTTVNVLPEGVEVITIDELYALADEILAGIITDDMSQYDKAHAIFTWVRSNIMWSEHSIKEDWVEAAYEGFTDKRGDCYTFASTSKALLTRAGIPNIDIKRNSTLSKHFWNLIDCGDGWYHYDATPRNDKTVIFYWSESMLQGDEAVRRSHVYDKTLYPTVNWQ